MSLYRFVCFFILYAFGLESLAPLPQAEKLHRAYVEPTLTRRGAVKKHSFIKWNRQKLRSVDEGAEPWKDSHELKRVWDEGKYLLVKSPTDLGLNGWHPAFVEEAKAYTTEAPMASRILHGNRETLVQSSAGYIDASWIPSPFEGVSDKAYMLAAAPGEDQHYSAAKGMADALNQRMDPTIVNYGIGMQQAFYQGLVDTPVKSIVGMARMSDRDGNNVGDMTFLKAGESLKWEVRRENARKADKLEVKAKREGSHHLKVGGFEMDIHIRAYEVKINGKLQKTVYHFMPTQAIGAEKAECIFAYLKYIREKERELAKKRIDIRPSEKNARVFMCKGGKDRSATGLLCQMVSGEMEKAIREGKSFEEMGENWDQVMWTVAHHMEYWSLQGALKDSLKETWPNEVVPIYDAEVLEKVFDAMKFGSAFEKMGEIISDAARGVKNRAYGAAEEAFKRELEKLQRENPRDGVDMAWFLEKTMEWIGKERREAEAQNEREAGVYNVKIDHLKGIEEQVEGMKKMNIDPAKIIFSILVSDSAHAKKKEDKYRKEMKKKKPMSIEEVQAYWVKEVKGKLKDFCFKKEYPGMGETFFRGLFNMIETDLRESGQLREVEVRRMQRKSRAGTSGKRRSSASKRATS